MRTVTVRQEGARHFSPLSPRNEDTTADTPVVPKYQNRAPNGFHRNSPRMTTVSMNGAGIFQYTPLSGSFRMMALTKSANVPSAKNGTRNDRIASAGDVAE